MGPVYQAPFFKTREGIDMAFQTTHTGLIELRSRIDKLWGYL